MSPILRVIAESGPMALVALVAAVVCHLLARGLGLHGAPSALNRWRVRHELHYAGSIFVHMSIRSWTMAPPTPCQTAGFSR